MRTDEISDAIMTTLKGALANAGSILREGWEKEAEEIALDAAHYAVLSARGDTEAENLLEHLRVQAGLVAARILVAESNVASATIETVLMTSAQVLGIVLKGIA